MVKINNEISKYIKKTYLDNILKRYKKENINISFTVLKCGEIKYINSYTLNHNYETDILTFVNKNKSEVFICLDFIKKNNSKKDIHNEIRRVIIHGVLHSIGYKDSNIKDELRMRRVEDYWLFL